ncbi:MAG TPA: tetratricopeptide repeat protein [Chryseolinea sp.]|nr:tetratricopeptide repeat protein [Chryseolinea sp.]
MKSQKTIISILLFSTCTIGLLSWTNLESPNTTNNSKPISSPIAMCGSFPLQWNDTIGRAPAKILPGLGNLHYPITTKSVKAQEFFEQGLRLIYAFNHWEAIQAFKEASKLDPDCAMAYWGLALAFGPNLNDWNPKDRERMALEAIQKAQSKKERISQVEKDFIDAMAARYDGKAYENRDSLNRTYADAMMKLAKQYPDDAEAQTLCADAIMNTMPWDYWKKDGSPKPETAAAKKILENVLQKFPNHPGAHHLYIHLVEASATPELGLKSAQFLETAMPGAGHIVHMPAHIYVRVGEYSKSIESNIIATKVDEQYLSYSNNQGMYRLMYYPHNIDFISFSSYMEGRSNLGIQTALKLAYKGSFSKIATPGFSQYLTVEPMIAYTRFGKWGDILALPDPGSDILYAQVMWRFSRGMAFIRSGYTSEANIELAKLDSLNKLDTLKSIYISFNPVSSSSQIASSLLRGEILVKEKKFDEAITAFRDAVQNEDSLRYNEPPDWKIPTRHFLGAALLDAGKFEEAEKVYLEDLKINRENGWSLTGLQQCYLKQGKKSNVAGTAKRFAKAWKNSDIAINASRF